MEIELGGRPLEIVDPMDLPPHAPMIFDFQRSKVAEVESSLSRELSPAPPRDVEKACKEVTEAAGGLLKVEHRPGDAVEYVRESESTGILEVGELATLDAVLHGAAHHTVHTVFPPHGAEWAEKFVGLLGSVSGSRRAKKYSEAFVKNYVHVGPEVRMQRVRKSAIGAVHKQRGVLARVVTDDEPESIVCQLLDVTESALLVLSSAGKLSLDLSRLRYMAYKLS